MKAARTKIQERKVEVAIILLHYGVRSHNSLSPLAFGAAPLKLTPELRAFALEQAGRRCECTGDKCRHHLRGARCKHRLRGDQWKVFWRSEGGGITRGNVEAWCLDCFANNFEVPRETVALLAPGIVGLARMLDEDRRTAITLKSVLRDAADRAASGHRGRMVFDRLDDDVLVEFATTRDALEGARALSAGFLEMAGRLDLTIPGFCGAIHYGEVTRWRNGLLVGDAVDITMSVRSIASSGQVVITAPALEPLKGKVETQPIEADLSELPSLGEIWMLQL